MFIHVQFIRYIFTALDYNSIIPTTYNLMNSSQRPYLLGNYLREYSVVQNNLDMIGSIISMGLSFLFEDKLIAKSVSS